MKLHDWLEFGGVVISNGNRTKGFFSFGLFTLPISTADCGCDTIDDDTTYANTLDAPWYEGARPESAEFLGLMAHDIRLDSIAVRGVVPKVSVGATIGRLRLRHRIVSVRGLMLAQTAQGQAYGESWLRDVLAGAVVGCAPDTLRILLSCPPDGSPAAPQWRTLRRVGVVDGPNFGPVGEVGECFMQEVQFQIAAGVPWLLGDEILCLAESIVTGS